MLIPTIVTPLDLYFCCSSVRCGTDVRHGGHQVAQNSSTRTCGRSGVEQGMAMGAPFTNVKPVRLGQLLPTDMSAIMYYKSGHERA